MSKVPAVKPIMALAVAAKFRPGARAAYNLTRC